MQAGGHLAMPGTNRAGDVAGLKDALGAGGDARGLRFLAIELPQRRLQGAELFGVHDLPPVSDGDRPEAGGDLRSMVKRTTGPSLRVGMVLVEGSVQDRGPDLEHQMRPSR